MRCLSLRSNVFDEVIELVIQFSERATMSGGAVELAGRLWLHMKAHSFT